MTPPSKKSKGRKRMVLGEGYCQIPNDSIYYRGIVRLTDNEKWKTFQLKNIGQVNGKKIRLIAEILP